MCVCVEYQEAKPGKRVCDSDQTSGCVSGIVKCFSWGEEISRPIDQGQEERRAERRRERERLTLMVSANLQLAAVVSRALISL